MHRNKLLRCISSIVFYYDSHNFSCNVRCCEPIDKKLKKEKSVCCSVTNQQTKHLFFSDIQQTVNRCLHIPLLTVGLYHLFFMIGIIIFRQMNG